MAEWITPITNRTPLDVSYAKQLNLKIRKAGTIDVLTEDEKAAWLRGLIGALNAVDLNRIESNTQYLKDILLSYGYSSNTVIKDKGDWTISDMPFLYNLERLRQNVQNIVDAYYIQKTEVPKTLAKPTYVELNEIEKVLFLLEEMIRIMTENFRMCGTFFAGEDLILP